MTCCLSICFICSWCCWRLCFLCSICCVWIRVASSRVIGWISFCFAFCVIMCLSVERTRRALTWCECSLLWYISCRCFPHSFASSNGRDFPLSDWYWYDVRQISSSMMEEVCSLVWFFVFCSLSCFSKSATLFSALKRISCGDFCSGLSLCRGFTSLVCGHDISCHDFWCVRWDASQISKSD